MIILCHKDRIYDWYAGSYREFYKYCPNDIITWEVLLWGKANGFKIFDFGGAGKPEIPYGVRDYKMKFGGELVQFGRYIKVHRKLLMALAKFGLKLYKKFKN